MKKLMLFLSLGIICLTASAQMYRIVHGQYYRTDDLAAWRTFNHLEVRQIFFRGGIVVQEFEDNTSAAQTAGFKAKSYGVTTSTRRQYGEIILLKNFHSPVPLAPRLDIGYAKAMLAGTVVTVPWGEISIYDVGVPYYPPPVKLTPQQIMAKQMMQESNTIVFWKSQAANGEADYQFSLGKWYMTNSYARDTNAGMALLQKAITQNNADALNYVQELATNPVTAQP